MRRGSARQLIDFLQASGMPLEAASIRREHIEAYLNDLAVRGRSEATRALRYRSLRVFFEWLVSEDEIRANPMEKMRPPKVAEQPIRGITDDELLRMLAAAGRTRSNFQSPKEATFASRRDAALLLFYFDTGARLSELANLKVEDLNRDTATARITRKGGNVRVIAYSDTVKDALNRYFRVRGATPRHPPALAMGRSTRTT